MAGCKVGSAAPRNLLGETQASADLTLDSCAANCAWKEDLHNGPLDTLCRALRGHSRSITSEHEDALQLLGTARRRVEVLSEELREADTAAASRQREEVWEESCKVVLQLLEAAVPSRLVTCLRFLDFEVQKEAIRLFAGLLALANQSDMGSQVSQHIRRHPEILDLLLKGAGSPEVAWQCAEMLRRCVCSPQLVEALLEKGALNHLLNLVRHQNFDIASEAFSCLNELLLVQKDVTAKYLEAHFKDFFGKLHALLNEDYVKQRQALKLLGGMLLHPSFMEVMLEYVSNEQFLQIHMKLLRHSSRVIQTDAFHVFKIFVGNPHKPRRVQQILYQNKDKLEKYLPTFYLRREDDETFVADVSAVIGLICSLQPPPRRVQSLSLLPKEQP